MPCDQVIALVLAAGRGRRFGADKRRACLADGTGVLEATLRAVMAVHSRVYVVLRPEDSPAALRIPPEVAVIRALHAARGMGASLAEAVSALADTEATALAVFLGDMPWINAETQQCLYGSATRSTIVRPHYRGSAGHPVLFGRDFWPDLQRLDGDEGARKVLRQRCTACVGIDVEDPGILRDVDTPADLQQAATEATF
ncbi:Purine catabolism protein PucB [compost metagenome]